MSYIGQGLPADSFQGFTTDSFTVDGSATTFTLSKKPFDESALLVVINNVVQKPTTNFTVSGTTLTIVGTAVASGDVIYATHIGGALPIGQAVSVDLNGASDQLILDADADTTISADTDDQIDVKVGGTDRVSFTSTGINLTQDGDSLKFGANSEVVLTHVHDQGLKMSHDGGGDPDLILANTASASDGNQLGTIFYNGQNSNGDEHTYAFILGQARDVTDGEEDGQLIFYGNKGGSDKQFINYGANANGASPTHEVCINEGSEDIDFRVESDGSTHQLFVDAGNGRVGIGTSSPDYTLHVRSTGSPSNDTFIDIEANATDSNVGIQFTDSGGTLNGRISYDTDDDNLQFNVSAAERARINGNGNMSIGTSVELGRLHLRMPTTAGTDPVIHFSDAAGDDCGSIDLNASANTVAYTTSSDYRLKENVNYDFDATTRLKKLKPARFNFKNNPNETVDGFLAHEVSDVVALAVTGVKDETKTKTKVVLNSQGNLIAEGIEESDWIAGKIADDDGNTEYPTDSTWEESAELPIYQGIDQSKLVPLMVKTIQELEARIKTLEDA